MINEKMSPLVSGYKRRRGRKIAIAICISILVVFIGIVMLMYGEKCYSISTVVNVLKGEEIKGATFAIMNVRLPKVLAGALAGIAFGMAGSTFQMLFHNPLASPDIMGVTSGASAAAVFGILILHIRGSLVSIMAVVAGILVAGTILLLSKGKGATGGRMILIGIGMQAMLNAIISFLLLKSSEYEIASALRWLSGSLNGVKLDHIPRLFVIIVLFGGVILCLNKHLFVMQLGEELSVTLGVRTNLTRLLLMFSAVFLIAFATAITGPIASVAFLSGPIAKRLAKSGDSNIITAGMIGALLVLVGEFIGQYAFATRYPVGVITGMIGAPYLLLLLRRQLNPAK